MVWKNTAKVGFGVKGDTVIAWYCSTKGNAGGPEDFKVNVGAVCLQNGYNKCYADLALTAHRTRRAGHEAGTPEIKLDTAGSV
jgi:hypothetical protein